MVQTSPVPRWSRSPAEAWWALWLRFQSSNGVKVSTPVMKPTMRLARREAKNESWQQSWKKMNTRICITAAGRASARVTA